MVFGTAYAAIGVTPDDSVVAFDINGAVATVKDAFIFDANEVVEALFVVEMHPAIATRMVIISATATSLLE
jgi:hypothetical protein